MGCDQIPQIQVQPTITDLEMQTKVASILTSYPTPTLPAFDATPETVMMEELPEDVMASPDPEASTEETLDVGGLPTNTPPISVPTQAPTETPAPTLEPTATEWAPEPTTTLSGNDPAYRLGTPSWEDPMDTGDNWPLESDQYTAAAIKDGYLQLTGLKKDNGWRLTINDLENFYMDMTVQSNDCSGTDRYGLMVRVPSRKEANRGYWFQINCRGQYAFQKWDGSEEPGKVTGIIGWTSNAAINPGSMATNRIGIMAMGDTFTLYANGVKLATAKDDTWSKGGFGVIIGAKETYGMTINIDQIRYWINPVQ